MNVGDGKFEFVNDNHHRTMLSTAHRAISTLELWKFIKEDPGDGGFMFTNDPRVNKIYSKIGDLGYNGHSGPSFAITLRHMQSIAIDGYDAYRQSYRQ